MKQREECPKNVQDKPHPSTLNYCRNTYSAKELAGAYTTGVRLVEIIGLCAASLLSLYLALTLAKQFQLWDTVWIVISLFVGLLLADFVSGLSHWLADSYGSVNLPMVGKSFIRPFREHHIDPLSVTRHDFIETNGDNCFVILPIPAFLAYIIRYQTEEQIRGYYPLYVFLTVLVVLLMFTNQFHKWAHTPETKLPRLVVWLQNWHIILPPQHHKFHHIAPHETHFCPATGWCNYPLEAMGFWVGVEGLIERVTGVKPRTDDMKWAKK